MAGFRRGRINEEMTREMAAIVREVKDPRVTNALVSITSAEVTPDLKYAKIYFSVIGNSSAEEAKKGLESAKGFIRKQVAARLNLRQTPELSFLVDDSIQYGAHINDLLKKVGADKNNEK